MGKESINFAEISLSLVESHLSRSAAMTDEGVKKEEEIKRFVDTNEVTLTKLTTRQINALRVLAGKAESIEEMKDFLDRKLNLAYNAWHFDVEDTFNTEKKSYNKLARVLINRLDFYAKTPTEGKNVVEAVAETIETLLKQTYKASLGERCPEKVMLPKSQREELRLLLARDFLQRLARAMLVLKGGRE